MNKPKLFFTLLLALLLSVEIFSCKAETEYVYIEKPSTESGNPLEISLEATPINAVNGKTNTSTTVTATISSASTIKNVVYKKNGSINAATLLADEDAIQATVSEDDNTKWSFTITATSEQEGNGTYTVAAIDNAGREEIKQINITNFDFTPPSNVTAVSLSYESESESSTIILKWTDPSDIDFDHILISYITNDGTSDSEESAAVNVKKGAQTYTLSSIDSTKKYYRFKIKTVDVLENKSDGRFIRSIGNDILYDFHETVTSAGTTTINSKEYKLVYFGDFPKTIKSDDKITVDESEFITIGGNTYYLGSDNNYYAKCIENAYESSYTYSDGTKVSQSSAKSTKYFKVEPIKWRVLTENYNSTGKALLLAEDILTANVPYYYVYFIDRTLKDTTIYANNYKYSNIRAYLNGTANQFVTDSGKVQKFDIDWTDKGFLQSAFTSNAQSLIATTTVDNSAESTNSNLSKFNNGVNSYACDNTGDKIFLLSEKEVTTADYGFAEYNEKDNARIRMPTDWAMANYADIGVFDNSKSYGYWQLRSPSYKDNNHYAYVKDGCYALFNGLVTNEAVGIVPALCVSIEALPSRNKNIDE